MILSIMCDNSEYRHPGYVGTGRRLDRPMSIAADDLCLYHCLAAAVDLRRYYAASDTQRSMWAKRLRCKTIGVLKEHHLLNRAHRLSLSGSAGYPDEEDFFYLSMASGASFEIVQTGMAEPLCYACEGPGDSAAGPL